MQRQKSILSFLQRRLPESHKSDGDMPEDRREPHFPGKEQNRNAVAFSQPTASSAVDSSRGIGGIETPPEKVPRQVFPVVNDDMERPSTFASIKHRFVKFDDREKSCDRYVF